jgi:hypothetical protein
MAALDIDRAARASGLSPRQVRLLIEDGRLPASRPSGRWLIDERHLSVLAPAPARPEVQGARPIGADPPAEPEPPAADEEQPGESMGEVLGRLEEATVAIADLRAERDDLRLKLREQVSSLQRSLEDSMEELDHAKARVAELEASRFQDTVKEAGGIGARAALTPLFRATTDPRDQSRPRR